MKIHLYILSLFLGLFLSCNQDKKSIDLTHLNGYWEIDRVVNPSGEEKKYGFNEYVDFFKTEGNIGFRSKVKPQFGGKYKSNAQKITYRINTNNDSIFISYGNDSNTWNDLIIEATDQQICLQNKQGSLYYYRPYTPIIIDEEN